MASLKSIRKRISSVKNTQKITRAMKMVAGARLTRAQQRITALRPYAVKTGEVLRSVVATEPGAVPSGGVQSEGGQADGASSQEAGLQDIVAQGQENGGHPLLVVRPEKKVLLIVLSSDRGLCAGFNANISKLTERTIREKEAAGCTVSCAFIGKKAREYLVRRGATNAHNFEKLHDGLELSKATLVSEWFVPRFRKGEFDSVYLVYNEFKSAMTQIPVVEPLLPVGPSTIAAAPAATNEITASKQIDFEPSREALLDRLVPMYVDMAIFRALLESQASEFGARMSAMDAATRNAKEMIGKLTLVYNRARQAGITKELMEIVGGAEALKD